MLRPGAHAPPAAEIETGQQKRTRKTKTLSSLAKQGQLLSDSLHRRLNSEPMYFTHHPGSMIYHWLHKQLTKADGLHQARVITAGRTSKQPLASIRLARILSILPLSGLRSRTGPQPLFHLRTAGTAQFTIHHQEAFRTQILS